MMLNDIIPTKHHKEIEIDLSTIKSLHTNQNITIIKVENMKDAMAIGKNFEENKFEINRNFVHSRFVTEKHLQHNLHG